jgi:hypothetical protein
VEGVQLSDAVVLAPVVVGGLVVAAGATVNDTGIETLPPLYTVTATVAEYVPAASPAVFTVTAICALLVMLPLPGDTESQVALSDAVQFVTLLFDFETLTD